jgi:aryl-alcohol dehydrogenase-like predicted oxidoreductase
LPVFQECAGDTGGIRPRRHERSNPGKTGLSVSGLVLGCSGIGRSRHHHDDAGALATLRELPEAVATSAVGYSSLEHLRENLGACSLPGLSREELSRIEAIT